MSIAPSRDVSDSAGRKCARVFSGGDVSDEARRNVRSLEIELAKSEAVTQESLGRSARKFSPQEEHSAESAFQSGQRNTIQFTFCHALSALERRLF